MFTDTRQITPFDGSHLISKICNTEVKNSVIDSDDKEFCEKTQTEYEVLKKQLAFYFQQLSALQKQETNTVFSLDTRHKSKHVDVDREADWHNQLMFTPLYGILAIDELKSKAKEKFISRIINHFEHKYNLRISGDQLRETEKEYTYTEIAEFIRSECNGLNFSETGIERLKESFRKKIGSKNRIWVRGFRIELYDFVWYNSYSSTLKLNYDDKAVRSLVSAFSYFEHGSIEPINAYRNYLPSDEVDTSREYELPLSEKIHSVRFYKNRKVLIKFSTEATAKEFYELFALDTLPERHY